MAITVNFIYTSVHRLVKNFGGISSNPALPATGKLYVIRHAQANRFPFYIGTAINVQQRFAERLRAVRELGFRNADIANIAIAVIRIQVDGQNRQPDNLGFAGGIDVEHLLIRTHMDQGQEVRNIVKTDYYRNTSGSVIRCTFENPIAWAHFIPDDHDIGKNRTL